MQDYILAHEHIPLFLYDSKKDTKKDKILDSFEQIVEEYKKLYSLGVKTIVNASNGTMGRNLEFSEEVSERTKIKIIYSTGFYKENYLKKDYYQKNIKNLSKIFFDIMIKEIKEGIDNTSIKADFIGEIAYSKKSIIEEKSFEAAVMVQKETNVPIYTHTDNYENALEQVQFFLDHDVDPKKVCIGHLDRERDVATVIKIAQLGFYIGFDTIGEFQGDERRIEMLKRLEKLDLLDRLMISMNITSNEALRAFGGNGYNYMFYEFIPRLRNYGIKKESIEKILSSNASKFFYRETSSEKQEIDFE